MATSGVVATGTQFWNGMRHMLQYLDCTALKVVPSAKKAVSFRKILFKFFNSGSGRCISGTVIDLHFSIWKLWNPGGRLSEYYASTIAAKLRRGGAHKTLGDKKFLSCSVVDFSAWREVCLINRHLKHAEPDLRCMLRQPRQRCRSGFRRALAPHLRKAAISRHEALDHRRNQF